MKWGLGNEEGERIWRWVGGENKAMEMDIIALVGALVIIRACWFDCFPFRLSSASRTQNSTIWVSTRT